MERRFRDRLQAVSTQILSRSGDGASPIRRGHGSSGRFLESGWHSQWNQGWHSQWYQGGPNGSPVITGKVLSL